MATSTAQKQAYASIPGLQPPPVAKALSLPSTVSGSGSVQKINPSQPLTWDNLAPPQQTVTPQENTGGTTYSQVTPSGQQYTGPSGNPFLTDPGYLAALAAQQANSQQADAALKAAREAAIVQFGDPGLAGLGFDVDPTTAAAAQQNTQAGNSTLAQLQRQRDLNQQGIVNNLAAHGIIRSGDLGYRTGQNQQNYGTALYGAQQSVLSGLSQALANDLAVKSGGQATSNSALTSAYNTYVSNPQFWGAATDTGGTNAALNASAVAPVTAALAPLAPTGQAGLGASTGGVIGSAVSRLAARPANAYGAGTARGARPG